MNDLLLLLGSTVVLGSPLVLAAMGGLVSERSGVMNIALEGKMLAAACLTAVVSSLSGSAWAGVAAGVAAAVVLSLVHALVTQHFKADHIVSGMGINALAAGGTSLLVKGIFDREGAAPSVFLPVAGYWVTALIAALYLAWYLTRTRGGIRLMAVGNSPFKSRQMGLDPVRVRLVSLLAAGLLCGLGGSLIASNAGSFTDGMTSGRGFIALAALILGGWRPLPALAGCLAFGLTEALQLQLQGTPVLGLNIPTEAWNALPYLATLVALMFRRGRGGGPAGLGVD